MYSELPSSNSPIPDNASAGLYDFVGFGELAETTTQLLSLNLHQTARIGEQHKGVENKNLDRVGMDQVGKMILNQASDYLQKVREGFMLSVRTKHISNQAELRYLIERVVADWSQLSQELDLADTLSSGTPSGGMPLQEGISQEAANRDMERVRHQLLAFGMAVIALGQLPRLPSKQVTFPHSYGNPPTYSDIPIPNTPGEMLWRIEELEAMVRRLISDDLNGLVHRRYGSLRRTYGFFEASAWLSHQEASRFGVKKRPTSLLVL